MTPGAGEADQRPEAGDLEVGYLWGRHEGEKTGQLTVDRTPEGPGRPRLGSREESHA